MKRTTLLLCFTICVTANYFSLAQVGDMRDDAKENKEKTERESDGDYAESSPFFGRMIFGAFRLGVQGIGYAHRSMLDRKTDQPWIVSADANLPIGYHFMDRTKYFSPEITGMWGLFATNARINRIWDATGNFQTFDWQVVQINFVARPVFSLRAGIGLSVDTGYDQAYPDYAVNTGFHFKDRALNTFVEYRVSKDYETGQTPRREIGVKVEKVIKSAGPLDMGAFGGLAFQRWFSNTNFYFLQAGVAVHLK
jgi:hypothetical protein